MDETIMAINLTGFLGGLGTGFDAYAKEKRARTMEDRLQQREDLAQQKLDEGTSRNIYDRLVQITKDDALDEAETLKRLRLPTIDAVAKQQELEARRQRHENAKLIAGQLASQPGVTKLFGNVSGLLRPSMASGPGFQMPSPEVDPTRAFDLLTKERARIEGITTPGADKAGLVAQARRSLEGLVPKDMLDRMLPEYGASLGFGTATSPAKALQNPAEFFAQNQGFKEGVGGEKILPTGARQKVFYKDGTPMVEYAPELKAMYESPELAAQRVRLTSEQARRLEGLYEPNVRKAQADATLSEWKGKLAGKQFEWFDRVQGAKIHKDTMVKSGSGASDALRRMSILLAHQDRVAGMQQRGEQFQQMMGYRGAGLNLQSQALLQKAQQDFKNNFKDLQKSYMAAKQLAGSSTDKAMGGSQQAALQNMETLKKQIDSMQGQYNALSAGDYQLAGQMAGVGGSASMIDPSALMAGAGQPAQQGAIDPNMLMQMMMAQGAGQQQQAPAQQSPIVFSPQIFAGGQPGMAGGDQMNAILEMLMQRGVIPRGTNEQGAFIPAGTPGSVFPKLPQFIARKAEIKSKLGLMYTPDNVIEELAYKYPKGLPAGAEGELIKQTLQTREAALKRMQPRLAEATKRKIAEEAEQTPEAMQRRMAGQSTTRGGGGYPGGRGAQ
jgi:hypothetical protein